MTTRIGHFETPGRTGAGVFIGLAILGMGIWANARVEAQGPITTVVLATQELPGPPVGRRWAVRSDHDLSGTLHVHAGGFVHAVAGGSTLGLADGQQVQLQEGQATWVPEGVPH